jgi:hypothetical protein
MTLLSDVDQLKQQNALLLKALVRANREKDELRRRLATLESQPMEKAQ